MSLERICSGNVANIGDTGMTISIDHTDVGFIPRREFVYYKLNPGLFMPGDRVEAYDTGRSAYNHRNLSFVFRTKTGLYKSPVLLLSDMRDMIFSIKRRVNTTNVIDLSEKRSEREFLQHPGGVIGTIRQLAEMDSKIIENLIYQCFLYQNGYDREYSNILYKNKLSDSDGRVYDFIYNALLDNPDIFSYILERNNAK